MTGPGEARRGVLVPGRYNQKNARVISGPEDPTSDPVKAKIGTIFLNHETGAVYKKTGTGNTDWEEIGVGGGLVHSTVGFGAALTLDLVGGDNFVTPWQGTASPIFGEEFPVLFTGKIQRGVVLQGSAGAGTGSMEYTLLLNGTPTIKTVLVGPTVTTAVVFPAGDVAVTQGDILQLRTRVVGGTFTVSPTNSFILFELNE